MEFFFLIDKSMPLVIHGFIANLACFRLIRICGACLLIVVEIISTNWSKTKSKLSQFKGKFIRNRLSNLPNKSSL